MKKFIAATLFCATVAIPAVAQGPNAAFAPKAPASSEAATAAANMVPVPGAVAAPVGGEAIYGGDMAAPRQGGTLSLPAGPAPSLAWIFALGFLGLIILRRTRSSTAL